VRRALLILLGLAGAACGASQRTIGSDAVVRPPVAASSPDEAFGAQIKLSTEEFRVLGELIACDAGYAYVHVNSADDMWMAVPWIEIREAKVLLPGAGRAVAIAAVAVSLAGAASHGWFAIYTAPGIAVVGAPTIVGAYLVEPVSGRCDDIRPYARFPAGVPPTLWVAWVTRATTPFPVPWTAPPAPAPPPPAAPPAAPPPTAPDAGAPEPATP
jgi:hypothetical protein